MSSMGDNIRALRLKHNMTQEELGRHLGVQKSAIRKYESGMVENIPRSSIKKMADLFGVKPSALMGWEEKEKSPSSDGLSEGRKALIDFAMTVPEDKAAMILQVMKTILAEH